MHGDSIVFNYSKSTSKVENGLVRLIEGKQQVQVNPG